MLFLSALSALSGPVCRSNTGVGWSAPSGGLDKCPPSLQAQPRLGILSLKDKSKPLSVSMPLITVMLAFVLLTVYVLPLLCLSRICENVVHILPKQTLLY